MLEFPGDIPSQSLKAFPVPGMLVPGAKAVACGEAKVPELDGEDMSGGGGKAWMRE